MGQKSETARVTAASARMMDWSPFSPRALENEQNRIPTHITVTFPSAATLTNLQEKSDFLLSAILKPSSTSFGNSMDGKGLQSSFLIT